MYFQNCVLVLLIFTGISANTNTNRMQNTTGRYLLGTNSNGGCLHEDEIHLSAPELIQKRGFPFQAHPMQTRQGYILTAHRIPAPGKPVVIAFHGMFQSSRDFLMNCDRKAFAYKMWDAGFDVWLVNSRGNVYSRGHTTLNADCDAAYWDFTVDDVIYFDVPVMIDYILAVTGQTRVNWVGYSLGTAVAMGLGSVHPEYSQKINLLFLLGTIAHVGNTKSPVMRALAPFAKAQDVVMTALNHGETLPLFMYPIMRTFLPIMCGLEAKTNTVGFCSFFLFLIAGFNKDQSNPSVSVLPLMLGGTPTSLGIKMLSQWYQWIDCGKFSYYDYGSTRNLQKYGKSTPPEYDLTKVATRVVNMWGQNDWLSVPEDVQRVVRALPNVVLNYRVKMDTWNHLDFIYGKDADVFVYDEIINAIRTLTLP